MSTQEHTHWDGVCPFISASSSSDPHAYCPPQRGDSRSPCPALNSLANHGYLSRDGKCITPRDIMRALQNGFHLSLPLAWFLTYGGFYLLGQRRKRICLADLARHNCIEHNASLAHPDVEHRDEYAPTEICPDLLGDFLRHARDGSLMTPEDVARARVRRESTYDTPMDPLHAEIARGEMAIVLNLFNNPAPQLEVPADSAASKSSRSLWSKLKRLVLSTITANANSPPLPGVPVDFLRTWMHEERLPDGWTPYHRLSLAKTVKMASRLRSAMKTLEKERTKEIRETKEEIARAVTEATTAQPPTLTIVTTKGQREQIAVEVGSVGGSPLVESPAEMAPTTHKSTISDLESEPTPAKVGTPTLVNFPSPSSSASGSVPDTPPSTINKGYTVDMEIYPTGVKTYPVDVKTYPIDVKTYSEEPVLEWGMETETPRMVAV
ncbi:hypothetical protein AcW1_004071 [Taiwanofungus camphoratus]|nr:hypothetical protein AcW1_004071 [Antrodia cinnamomea]